jgi:hypothetical protein
MKAERDLMVIESKLQKAEVKRFKQNSRTVSTNSIKQEVTLPSL